MVMETLRRVASSAGVTVITTLHHVEYARSYADRVVGFREGQVVFDGKPVDLTDKKRVKEIFGETRTQPDAGETVPSADPSRAAS